MPTHNDSYGPAPSRAQVQLIDDLGGPVMVAELVTRRRRLRKPMTPQAISMWKTRGIPYRYRGILCQAAGEQGVAVPANFLTGDPEPDDTPGFLVEEA